MTQRGARTPYGAWPSPISAATVAAGGLRLGSVQLDGDDVYWIEGRPAEQGRCEVVRYRNGHAQDVLGAPFSARSFVHEYGGGALLVDDGVVHFTNAADRRLYVVAKRGKPEALTPDLGDVRYADMVTDAQRQRLISVVEDHRGSRVINDIRAVPLDGREPTTLVGGNDFYSTPRISPEGTQLAWLTWNQPNMPWHGTELWIAGVDEAGALQGSRRVAGGESESIFQPTWSPDGTLFFCSDRTGWWNLYRLDGDSATAVAPMEAECGKPQWGFGMSTYAFMDQGRVALAMCRNGMWELVAVDTGSGNVSPIELPYTALGYVVARGRRVTMLAAGPHEPMSIVTVDIESGAHTVLRRSSEFALDDSVLSIPRAITFPGTDGVATHAFFYPPQNDQVEAEPGARPPLLLNAHGGPTSQASAVLDLEVQYWTSRGFAYLDVNYGGSTGYGRAYRERLNGSTGVVDVEDCVAGARHLAQQGDVDPSRLLIQGGSAGGYIALCAMTFHDAFAAGASHYGIADWETLVEGTHKFEARYNDSLIGPYPECRDLYYQRSPIHVIEGARGALILFHGLDDPVVPVNQTEVMFEALRAAGIPCAYIAFPGEMHGFRQAANIARSLEAQLYFFSRVLGFEIADIVEPVDIANLDVVLSSER